MKIPLFTAHVYPRSFGGGGGRQSALKARDQYGHKGQ
jgi:hypothetical protein